MKPLRFSIVNGTTTTILEHAPKGWDENSLEITRSTEFHGFLNCDIPKLNFVKDGAKLLRTIYYTNLPNYSKTYLKIEKLDTINLTYSQLTYGEIKWSEFTDSSYDVSVTVVNGSLAIKLTQNYETSYDISSLIGDTSFRYSPSLSATTISAININSLLNVYFFNLICSDGLGFGYTLSGMTNPIEVNGSYIAKGIYNNEYFFINENNNYVLFKIGSYWAITAGDYPPTPIPTNHLYSNTGILGTWYVGGVVWTGVPDMAQNVNSYAIDVSVFSALENSIVITTGYFIRLQTTTLDVSKISISLQEIYKSLLTIYSVGMGIELIGGVETLVFKAVEYFYDNVNEIENIGDVKDFTFKIWDKAINSVKIGFPEKSYQYTQDIFECSGENTYNINDAEKISELNLISKFRGDFSGITDIILGKINDEDIFFVCIKDSGSGYNIADYNDVRKISDHLTTLPHGNIQITPEQCLIINKNYICSLASAFFGYNFWLNLEIKNQILNSQKNVYDIESTLDGGTTWLQEREGLLVSSGTRFLAPFIFEFTGQVSEQFYDNYLAHPYGFISFGYEGNTYKGFILEAKINMAYRDNVKFKLISCPDNVFTNLIR